MHGAQLVFARKWEPFEQKVEEDARGAEELTNKMADRIGLVMRTLSSFLIAWSR